MIRDAWPRRLGISFPSRGACPVAIAIVSQGVVQLTALVAACSPAWGRRENLIQANKLSRTCATLALDRHRGEGQQKVTVEHVHVHSGGQAVLGMVAAAGAGGRMESEDQPPSQADS